MMLGKWTIVVACAAALAACGGNVHIGGNDGGTTTGDGGRGEPCGPVTCGAGLECCNASCGVCAPPGTACTAIACADAGGGCIDCALPPPGCHYEGGDGCTSCGTLVCSACGTRGGVMCGPSQYCDYDAGCGFDDGGGTCRPRPDACPRIDDPVCGCDGLTYSNACVAAASGVDVQYDGPCAPPPPPPPGSCDPMNARGEGACDLWLGYVWNGVSCESISGCSCVGSDCGAVGTDLTTCEALHRGCSGSGAQCGGHIGGPCPASEWCDYTGGGCGFADGGGYCRTRPTACAEIFAPACGCDGTTYENACSANGAGTDIIHTGPCETPVP